MRAPADITKTPAFRRWFGKSQVVDASGRPLVLYHGTTGDFTAFDFARARSAYRVIFLTPDPSVASDFSMWMKAVGTGTMNVLPLYVRARRLLEYDAEKMGRRGESIRNIEDRLHDAGGPGIYRDAQRRGYDGVVFRNVRDDPGAPRISPVTDIYAFFDTASFKSAIGNRGTFDPKDPDIRHNPRRPRRNDNEQVARVPVTETAAFRKWFGDSKVVNRQGQPLVVYHGTDHGGFFEFDFNEVNEGQVGFYFTDSRQMAYTYTGAGRRGADPTPPYHETVEDAVLSGLSGDETFTIEVEGSEEDGDLVYSLFDEGSHVGYYRAAKPKDMTNLLRDVNALSYTDQKGVYEVYLRIEDPFVVDAGGAGWDSVPLPDEDEESGEAVETMTTREIASMAMDMGFDGAIIRNVYDFGQHGQGHERGDVFIVFDANQIKSSASNRGTFSREDNDIRKNPRRRFR